MAAFIGDFDLDSDHLILPDFHRIQQTVAGPKARFSMALLFTPWLLPSGPSNFGRSPVTARFGRGGLMLGGLRLGAGSWA
jgi:hypothetical protein